MKKLLIYNWLSLLFTLIVTISFTACSSDTELDYVTPTIGSTNLKGTKWTLTNWDYSLGDEYIGLHNETYQFFFHSQTEGVFYYGKKDNYSDQGSSNKRIVCHFKYTVIGNTISLEYITEQFLHAQPILNGDILIANKLNFAKGTISNTDYQWLNTIQGISGSCSWYSDMNGTLCIVGEGPMANYTSYSATPWAKNNRTPNKVIIEEGVTAIGSYAFANPSITDIDMPNTCLEHIGDAAFKGTSVKYLYMTESIKTIGKEAFANCTDLKQIYLPEEIVSIGEYAFSGCTALNEFQLEFSSNLRTIGKFAFEGGEVSYLIFNEGVQTISTGAFIGDFCNISKELILPNTLTKIGATAFEGPYKKIVIGTGVTEIGDKAFISGATSGSMYINRATPPSTGSNIIVERTNWNSAESRWTLYVPKGCKSAYSKKAPWNKFKSIIEDNSLQGGTQNDNNNDWDSSTNGEIAIDLGLSVKWASCNVGATQPWEYGGYYAWGETEEKGNYSWGTYKYCNGDAYSMTKYCTSSSYGTVDNKTTLEASDDVATVKWGGAWRMPTRAELDELCDNCTWQWTTLNGVNGYRVTGPNGNSIFLPAAGLRGGTEVSGQGSGGYYWSSSLYGSRSCSACFLYFFSGGYDWSSYSYRYRGLSVRPVCP